MQSSLKGYPRPKLIEDNSRFENREEYIQRIRMSPSIETLPSQSLLVNDSTTGTTKSQAIPRKLSDVVRVGESFRQQSIVTKIDIRSDLPRIVDSEVLVGANIQTFFMTDRSAYLAEPAAHVNGWPTQSHLFRIDLSQEGDSVRISSIGQVRGSITSPRMMDEHEGYLRVVTNDNASLLSGRTDSANLFVMHEQADRLVVSGELLDIANGQRLDSVYFSEKRAIVTTSSIDVRTMERIDPIHGIDLSDPTRPVEKSDVIIPGFANHLQWIDGSHLVGIGAVQDIATGAWHWQLSLFDVADISNPRVVGRWISEVRVWPSDQREPLSIAYDPTQKVLVVPFASFGLPALGQAVDEFGANGAWVYRVDPESSTPIQHLGTVDHGTLVKRAFVRENQIVSLSNDWLYVHDIDHFDTATSATYLHKSLGAFLSVPKGSSSELALEHVPRLPLRSKVISVEPSRLGVLPTRTPLGVAYDASQANFASLTDSAFDDFVMVVETPNGQRVSIEVTVSIYVDSPFRYDPGMVETDLPLPMVEVLREQGDHRDIDGDGSILPIDVLLILNRLNDRILLSANAESTLAISASNQDPLDVNRDGYVSPLDALIVINELNALASVRGTALVGEGEALSIPDEAAFVAELALEEIIEGIAIGRRRK